MLGHNEKHCDLKQGEKADDRQYGEWMRAGGAAKNGGERGSFSGIGKPEPKGSDGTKLNPQGAAESPKISSQSKGEVREGQSSSQSVGSRMVLGVDLGTSMSNLSHQNSLQGWDITEGRKLDQKFKADKCNQGEGTKPDLPRETSNQTEDVTTPMDRGSVPSLKVHEVTSPMRPKEEKMISIGSKNQSAGPSEEGKGLSKGKLKKIARERGNAQDVDMSIQAHEVGKKRAGNLDALIETEGKNKKRLWRKRLRRESR